jgi:ERCC4-related helicase
LSASASAAASAPAAPLVFFLNLSASDEQRVNDELAELGSATFVHSINNEYSVAERERLYARGGCLAVTSRILIVDLLSKRAPPHRTAGLVIADAHRVTENSVEAFVLRVFREHNRTGFIKALSDAPQVWGGASEIFPDQHAMSSLHISHTKFDSSICDIYLPSVQGKLFAVCILLYCVITCIFDFSTP